MPRRFHVVATAVFAMWVAALGGPAHAQPPSRDPDSLLHVELTLSARQISVAFAPDVQAHRQRLAALRAGSRQTAIRVGRLEGHRSLRIGALGPEPGDPPPSAPNHDLWLVRTAGGWAFDARPIEDEEEAEDADENEDRDNDQDGDADDADEDDDAETASSGPARILLSHRATAESSAPLTFMLRPTGDDSGEMTLRWGRDQWATSFEFVELAATPRPERTSNVGRPTNLTADSDTSARYRAAALGTRNETALVTPAGAHIQVLFQKELGTDGEDFAALESIGDGDLVRLTRAAVIRLRTEVPLQFGDTPIPTENLAPDFPGSYGLWLRAVGSGWRLVFNNEPDWWGTQHDPAFDVTEIDLTHAHGGPFEDRPLAVSLLPLDGEHGRLVIHWGQHVWSADFTF